MLNDIIRKKEIILKRVSEARDAGGFSDPVTLVAVTKYHTTEEANDAVSAGIDNIGENHVQELIRKTNDGLLTCKRHFIGHLQTNKVRQLLTVPGLSLIQSVDSDHLIREIALRASCPVDILIQVNMANEPQKYGCPAEDAVSLVRLASSFENIRVKGYMSVMPVEINELYYRKMYDLYKNTEALGIPGAEMSVLSMGMSGDFETAVRCGSNMIRIGSYLFEK